MYERIFNEFGSQTYGMGIGPPSLIEIYRVVFILGQKFIKVDHKGVPKDFQRSLLYSSICYTPKNLIFAHP